MSSTFKKISLLFFFTALVAMVGFYVLQNNRILTVFAESDDNFSGYAWSSNIGWVSFNCTNQNNCSDSNYGVDLDMEFGPLSGYAWSPNIGWIDFDPDGPYPGIPQHGAKYEYTDTGSERRLTGWAKILTLEEDGWIKLNPGPWLDEEWGQRRQLAVDKADIDEDLSGFPVPIFINDSAGKDNKDVTSIFDEVGSDHKKLAVTGPDGEEQLYVEVEKWDASAEEALLWVGSENLELSADAPTYFYLYYDAEAEDNDEYVVDAATATSSRQIWGEDHELVHHFNENSGDALDSSPEERDGTVEGVSRGVEGRLDGAFGFDGQNDHVAIQDMRYDSTGAIDALTVCSWVNTDRSSDNIVASFDREEYWRLAVGSTDGGCTSGDGKVGWCTTDEFGDTDNFAGFLDVDDGDWHHICGVFSPWETYEKKIYVDGELDAEKNAYPEGNYLGTGADRYGFVGVGSEASGFDGATGPDEFFEGSIDEIRISSAIRSPAWIKAVYLAETDQLLDWGNKEEKNYGVTADINTGEFSGWAWNKSEEGDFTSVGWLSFDCSDEGAADCNDSDYGVEAHLNTVPEADEMTSPNWNFSNACSQGAKHAFLKWEIEDPDKGASQKAWRLIVDDSEDRDDPNLLDTDRVEGDTKQYYLDPSFLDYGQSYSWWIKMWDNHNISSEWHQYDTEPDTDNDDDNTYTFTVYEHEFPEPEFYTQPSSPSMNEDVKFVSTSSIYTVDEPTVATSCTDATCDYSWDYPEEDVILKDGDPDASSSIILEFTSTSTYTIGLQVTDPEGYYCGTSTAIDIKQPLPTWREIKVK